ncbi:MAG TPA: exodeoxyribonuclease III [Polyangiales bacterium]|nr:exodeoxyribonuclease III [Polyangiales bacterium]
MSLRVVSWNVNSLRARLPLVLRYLEQRQPDVLCLQETRIAASQFPHAAFEPLGYHCQAESERSYAGVATLSRLAIRDVVRGIEGSPEHVSRRLLCRVGNVWVDNLYVPTRKAIGKVDCLDRLRQDYRERFALASDRLALCGDFNICFDSRDLASLRMISEAESFGERVEDLAFRRLVAIGLQDCFRKHHTEAGSFSWFPMAPWAIKRNYGMRLDYVFATAPLYARCVAAEHDREPRSWQRPSDHLPVCVEFEA